jgi:hypothetical protein
MPASPGLGFGRPGRLVSYLAIANLTQPQPFSLQTVQPRPCSCWWTTRSWPQAHRSESRGAIAVIPAPPSPPDRQTEGNQQRDHSA